MIHIRRIVTNDFKQLTEVDLTFPRRGRFLIQGLNEAGKSTLFEAVYFALFGRPLAAESGHGRLDDVIRYGAAEAWVELVVSLDGGRSLRVMRRVRRGRQNVWELDVIAADGVTEEVRGNSVVNERIAAELKLDGEALLNTCFVEQKKLEKLEGMNRGQREQSLMKLLNLDRILEMSDRLRVRPADTLQLARLRDRAELAHRQAELPLAQTAHARAVDDVERAQAREAIGAVLREADALAELRTVADSARERSDALAARAGEAERARASIEALRDSRTARDRALEGTAALARAVTDLVTAEDAAEKRVPRIIARGTALRRVLRRRDWLSLLAREADAAEAQARTADAVLAQWGAERDELDDVERRLAIHRAAAREAASECTRLADDVRAFQWRDAIEDWLRAAAACAPAPGDDDGLARARAARDRAARRQRLETAVGLATIVICAAVGATAWRPVQIAAIAALVLFAWRQWWWMRRLPELARAVGRLEGEAALRRREEAVLATRVESTAARLRALGATVPPTVAFGHEVRAEVDARLGSRSRAVVDEALASARAARLREDDEVAALQQRQQALRDAQRDRDGAVLVRERNALRDRAARLRGVIARRSPALSARAADLGAALDSGSLEGDLGELRAELLAMRALAERVPSLRRVVSEARETAEAHWKRAEVCWDAAARDAPLDAWSRERQEDDWVAVEATMQRVYDAAGGDAVRQGADAAAREAARSAGQLAAAQRAHENLLDTARRRLEDLRVPTVTLPHAPSRGDLADVLAVLEAAVSAPIDALTVARERAAEHLNVVRHEVRRLETAIGLAGEHLDAVEADREHAAAARALDVRRKAAEIVEQAGRNVVQSVLPSTLAHMRRMLPALTRDRYFDAQLSEDYRIEVYDDRAKAWKQKNIFSGGARDQFSLALRLSFAIATLPAERGVAPSFVFLDEPLGAFDPERARALIDQLTSGEIADAFDQIFLISHVPVDAGSFDHRILLEEGRVAETSL